VIGDRWTILILRDLVRLGPRKFQDLEHRPLFPQAAGNLDQSLRLRCFLIASVFPTRTRRISIGCA
jgi:hypothetical protein